MKRNEKDFEQKCVNVIRGLAMDGVQKANSGHPGMPMGAADMAFVLWTKFLKHNPLNPDWSDRDRFVLSAGHGSMLLYSLLYLTGYDLPMEELKSFRQWDSRTPGHPEYGETPGVEVTTGPLGQGFTNGVGMAIAAGFLAGRFNRPGFPVADHYIYAIVSDGDLMEGISHEAASLAGHLKLGRIIYLYDDNHITIEGSTDLAFTEDVGARFAAYGWHVQRVDGHDRAAIEGAIRAAQAEKERPSLILCRTHIAYGSPNAHDTAESHGAPLGEEEVRLTKEALGLPPDEHFYVPDDVLNFFRQALDRGKDAEEKWQEMMARYGAEHPELAAELKTSLSGELPEGWEAHLPTFDPAGKGIATRNASGTVLNAIAPHIPNLMGGSADLSPSNKTHVKAYGSFAPGSEGERNLHFGVREHGMGGILNGMALHGGVIPYGGTFLVFSDYMRPSIRLAALMEAPVIYVFTHDSIGVGEDGPTHQPVEHFAALRCIPGLVFIRPADANETADAWRFALEYRDGPVAFALTRQGLPVLEKRDYTSTVARGAYVLADADGGKPDVILMASGSEVQLAVDAKKQLESHGVDARVVSFPSWELFEMQPDEYKDEVLPPKVTARLAVEAGVTMGWERYVGDRGQVIGLNRFGASAPYKEVMVQLGFTVDNVTLQALALVDRSRK